MLESRRRPTLLALSVLATLCAVAVSPSAGAAAPRASSKTITIAPGLTLTRITTNDPQQIRVLTVDVAKPLTLDLTTAGATYGSYAKTSTMATDRGALAAVNGDFSIDGRPLHPFAEDGVLRGSGLQGGGTFAVSKTETGKHIGTANLSMSVTNLTSSTKVKLTGWNLGAAGAGEVVGFTGAGGSVESPPSNACSVRLLSPGKMHWEPLQVGIYKDYKVDAQKCQSSPMTLSGGVVLSARLSGTGADFVKTLTPGTTVRLSWSDGYAGVMDSLGGMPVLVDNGTVVAKNDCGTYFCDRNPRTAVGITGDGKILLVTVDGRCTCSLGMTLVGMANEMKSLGAKYALNLDGGGGTTMWVKGQGVVNTPSDSTGERPVTNAVAILPGGDVGEPSPLAPFIGPVGPDAAAQAAVLAAGDPGSTGGLLAALQARAFGPTPRLPDAWAAAARGFSPAA